MERGLGGSEMDTTMLGPRAWAREEFQTADVGDERRRRRLMKVAEAVAKGSQGILAATVPHGRELKGAYRLFASEDVTYEGVLGPHFARTQQACQVPGSYLLVEDTTDLDYSKLRATEGLGRIGNDYGRGLYLHPTLALRLERWDQDRRPEISVVGLFAQKCWARTIPKIGKESDFVRMRRQRESARWAEAFAAVAPPPPDVQWTYVADRESDIYEVMLRCAERSMDFIIRANHPRKLEGQERPVRRAVEILSNLVSGIRRRPA
jgi:hypothetical protein